MLGEGTLTRLIKVYNPVAAGEDLGGIRERERKGGKEERREVEKERGLLYHFQSNIVNFVNLGIVKTMLQ